MARIDRNIINTKCSYTLTQALLEIEAKILTGELKENQQLPSIRELASKYSLSNATVQKIYALLKVKKFIYSIPGKGYYVQSSRALKSHEINLLKESIEQIENSAQSLGMCFDEVVLFIKNTIR